MKKIVLFLLILGILMPSFSFSEITPPETVEGVKALGEKALETGEKEMPGILKRIWQEEVLPVWRKMYNWFMINIWPKLVGFFNKYLKPEIEKRKPIIDEEFQKEKEEMKKSAQEEVPAATKSLWERFKELIK